VEAVLNPIVPPPPLSLPVATPPRTDPAAPTPSPKPWTPKQVLITPAALDHDYGRELLARFDTLGLPVTRLKANRVSLPKTGHPQKDYALAKNTLAVVVSPPSSMKLQPIPPSADWQFHLAVGCPAHCQYCYLAGSLSGPPITRVFANLDEILDNNRHYEGRLNGKAKQRGKSITPTAPGSDDGKATFEVSCYTDVLALEHLTGGLAHAINHFGQRPDARLRFVTKFARVGPLLGLAHRGHTRARLSVNATDITRQFEGGTAKVDARLDAAARLADDGYPVGLVIAPIFPLPDWQSAYGDLVDTAAERLAGADLTVELITHRFTPGSRDVLLSWYPNTKLDLDEAARDAKRNKFGGIKYVLPKATMQEMNSWFHDTIATKLPTARVLYWT
jgi:spore photoproduct lyase